MKKRFVYLGLFALVLILAITCFYFYGVKKEQGVRALIYKDGELIKTVSLEDVSEAYEFEIRGGDSFNLIRVEEGRIRVVSASCPDKVCVNSGYISDGVMPIVCLPNKLVIEIEGAEGAADGAAR
ncbi:MAG: NusG domain II-containing protein [Clostridiales bacterium]|nr:NusG domain II-containing protein [Clostridiales bacterium]